jgi:hypothetical protein
MTRVADLLEQAIAQFERGGETALHSWVASPEIAGQTEQLFCPRCDQQRAHIAHICVPCWAVSWARPVEWGHSAFRLSEHAS